MQRPVSLFFTLRASGAGLLLQPAVHLALTLAVRHGILNAAGEGRAASAPFDVPCYCCWRAAVWSDALGAVNGSPVVTVPSAISRWSP